MKIVNVVERNEVARLIKHLPSDIDFFKLKNTTGQTPVNTKFITRIPEGFFNIGDALAPREFAEKSPQYLQLIPYITFYCSESKEFLVYQRGDAGEESRLHSKFSLGFGGHIEIESSSWLSLKQVVAIETIREIYEEIGYLVKDEESDSVFNAIGNATLLYDDSDEVGSVHLGINFIFAFKNISEVMNFELGVINNAKWMTFKEIGELYKEGKFENWSNLFINSIVSIQPVEEVHAPEIPAPEQTEPPVAPITDTPAEVVEETSQGQ